ncbi:MAG: amidohydrolase family protein, partial [Gemmatimonadota bacterium]
MSRSLSFHAILGPDGIERDRSVEIGEDGRVVAVRPAGAPHDGFLALPGMPNAHSHGFQRALAGFGEAASGEDDSFWSWREAMYRLAAALDAEDVERIAAQAFVEMLRGGFTSVVEFHYLHHRRDGSRGAEAAEAVARAAARVGLPLVLLPVYYRRAGFGEETPGRRQARFAHRDVEEFLRLVESLDGIAAGVAPHSLRAVAPGELADLVEGADRLLGPACPLHIHVSEQTAEVEECRAAHGTTPIALLAEHVELG